MTIESRILEALRDVCSTKDGIIPLHEPLFAGREWKYVKECLDTGWVSSVGKYVDRFEQQLAEVTGAPHVVATVNGTAALHACMRLIGVGADDEVLVPALSFVATANAVAYQGATPHFVDSSERTLGIDPIRLQEYLGATTEVRGDTCWNIRSGRRIAAIVPMHTFGHPVDLTKLLSVAQEYRIPVVEDAAESLGSLYRGQHTGTFGVLGCLSFNGNKTITTGGGGAILVRDPSLAERAKRITTTAKMPHRWEYIHDEVGYNYRLPNINAALGCAQLEQLPGFLAAKRRLAGRYQELFQGMEGVRFVVEPPHAQSNYWLNTLLLDEDRSHERDTILAVTNDAGIMTRPAWGLLNELPMYASCPRMDLSVSESLARRLINLPSSASLGGQIGRS